MPSSLKYFNGSSLKKFNASRFFFFKFSKTFSASLSSSSSPSFWFVDDLPFYFFAGDYCLIIWLGYGAGAFIVDYFYKLRFWLTFITYWFSIYFSYFFTIVLIVSLRIDLSLLVLCLIFGGTLASFSFFYFYIFYPLNCPELSVPFWISVNTISSSVSLSFCKIISGRFNSVFEDEIGSVYSF